jgi:hypothetical protein
MGRGGAGCCEPSARAVPVGGEGVVLDVEGLPVDPRADPDLGAGDLDGVDRLLDGAELPGDVEDGGLGGLGGPCP